MSLWKLQKMLKDGIGPRLYLLVDGVFITIDDEREWRNMMRNPYGKAAEVANANAKMLHEKAKYAYSQRTDQQK